VAELSGYSVEKIRDILRLHFKQIAFEESVKRTCQKQVFYYYSNSIVEKDKKVILI
jgi:hypothetical protein